MSVIKVNKIEHTGTTAGGVEVDSSGHVQVDGLQMPTTGPLSNRNLFINGAMQVAQRGTSGTLPSTNNYLVDRMEVSRLGGLADIFDISQASDAPTDFTKSLKLTQDGTSVTLSGTNAAKVTYKPEGQDFAHLNWGTTAAKAITVSFYVKSSVTGTFAFISRSSGNDQDIAKEYTISSANTWERKEFSIPGPTSGTWGTGTNLFGTFTWGICGVLGSDRETSNINAWGGGSANTSLTVTANSTNAVATTSGATWQITGVQLEVGEKATPFEHRSYGDELARCHRYYELVRGGGAMSWSNGAVVGSATYKVEKRDTPSSISTNTIHYEYPSSSTWQAVNISKNGFTVQRSANSSAIFVDATWSVNAEL